MDQPDNIKAATSSDVKAPKEVKELTELIASMLEILTAPNCPISATREVTIHPDTPREEVRKMWRVRDGKPYFEQWIDSTGALWHFHFGEDFFITNVNFVTYPAGIIRIYITEIERFKNTLTT